MPGKSHRAKGGHPTHSRGKKGKRQPQPAARHSQQALVSSTKGPVSSSITPPLKGTPIGDRYRYVGAELRRIGIVAGAIFIILIVLTFVLS